MNDYDIYYEAFVYSQIMCEIFDSNILISHVWQLKSVASHHKFDL